MIDRGDILISSPYADTGIVFSKTVIYILWCDKNAVTGVIINKPLNQIDSDDIIKKLNLKKEKDNVNSNIPIYFGGPIQQEKGIIIHSSDYTKKSFNSGKPNILVNVDLEILKDIAKGNGPRDNMFILGYTAWPYNQLLIELKRSDWIILKGLNKQTLYDLIFTDEPNSKWHKALKLAGIDLVHFSNSVGNA